MSGSSSLTTSSTAGDEHRAAVDTAEAALLDPAVEHLVEVVLRSVGDHAYEAAAVDGRVRFRREPEGTGWRFVEERVEGRNPLGDQATDRFSPLAEERAKAPPAGSPRGCSSSSRSR